MNGTQLYADFRKVLRQYAPSCQPLELEHLGAAGGFSGAVFWRLATPLGRLCLRRWPKDHPREHQLRQIHSTLDHVSRLGVTQIPVPVRTLTGATYVDCGGQLWELAPWMPGEADYERRPNQEKLIGAVELLARFHLAAASFRDAGGRAAPSPGLASRHEQVVRLRQDGASRIRRSPVSRCWPEFYQRAATILDLFDSLADQVAAMLSGSRQVPTALQPCIRDVHHDHILFEGNRVSGMIDFGAMRWDTVSGDIARLVGSLAGDNPVCWQTALEAYTSIRPLSREERALISVFDRSTVLLSGMNWLWWICVEQRDFDARERVLARLDVTIRRLRHLSR